MSQSSRVKKTDNGGAMTVSQKLHAKTRALVKVLQTFADRYWYPPFIGFLAAIDNLIVVIPTDGILISSSMIVPKRWLLLAINVAIGSTLGALALAVVVEYQGWPLIVKWYPGIEASKNWIMTREFFESYGLFLVFLIAIAPLAQQPAVVLAALAQTPLWKLLAVVFIGRLIKYLIMAYIGSHAPKLLNKMWGVKEELKDTGINL
jgi:membrane protein YqaA with SNARE-associated domain